MNEYKVLCEVTIPKCDIILDVALPVNKSILYTFDLINKMIVDSISSSFKSTGNEIIVNKDTGKVYDKNVLIKDTDIKNGSRLVYY